MGQPLRLLIVDDSPDDVALLVRLLKKNGYQLSYDNVQTAEAMRSVLARQPWDVIVSDHSMPRFSAPAALAIAREMCPQVPFIIVSGEIDINLAVALLRGGAKDYIQKRELPRLIPAIERELREVELRREQQRTDAALRSRDDRLAEAQAIAHLGSWEWDMVSNTVTWSQEMYRLFGIDPQQYDGSPEAPLSVIHPDDVEIFRNSLKVNLTGEDFPSLEYRVVHADGSVHTLCANGKVEFDLDGKPLRSVGTVQDITERKAILEALLESKQKYKILFDSASVSIGYFSPEGIVISFNSAAARNMGGEPKDFTGKSIKELFPPEAVKDYLSRFHLAIETGEVHEYEDALDSPGGKQWFLTSFRRVTNAAGKVNGVQVIGVNITRTKKIEQALAESEAKHRRMIENISDVIAIIDREGIIRYTSPNIEILFGWSPEELAGTNAWVRVHPDDKQRIGKAFDEIIATDRAQTTVEFRYPAKDGRYHWINLTAANLNGDPLIGGILMNFHDITERMELREAQRLSEDKFATAFRISPDAINIARLQDGKYIDVNEGFCRATGYTPEEVLGKTSRDLNIWVNLEDRQRMVAGLLEHGEITNLEAQFRGKGGQVRTCLMSAIFIELDVGKCILSITRDITERKRTEEEIQKLNSELERRVAERTAQLSAANQELEAFAYSISHDLRAPLRNLEGYSEALQEEFGSQLDVQGRHYLNRIQASTQRMNQLTLDLLNLSKITTQTGLNRQRVDFSGLARTVGTELMAQFEQRRVDLRVQPDVVVEADESLLKIVMENLLSNAFKFTSQREQAVIEIGMTPWEGQPAYYVRDNGVGFDLAYAGKLFGPFQRLHDEKEFPGNGIGLAIVKRIILKHGGQIWAEGEVDRGATIWFTLPA